MNFDELEYDETKKIVRLGIRRMLRNMTLSGIARVLEVIIDETWNGTLVSESRFACSSKEYIETVVSMLDHMNEAIKISKG